jgi:hypothetical protein
MESFFYKFIYLIVEIIFKNQCNPRLHFFHAFAGYGFADLIFQFFL